MKKRTLVMVGLWLASSCGGSEIAEPTQPGRLADLVVVQGANQSGTVGQELGQPLGVRAVDEAGRPLTGRLVVFTVVSGGGSVFGGTVQTGSQGEARDRWTLGTKTTSAQVVRARSVDPETGLGAEVEFKATPLPGPPAELTKAGGDGQRAPGGTQLPTPLSALVKDGFGNVVPNVAVRFSVTAGGGHLSVESSGTNDGGVASTVWTLGNSGSQEVSATVVGIGAITYSAFLGFPELVWASLAPMPFAVRAATAATDGAKIYVFGGWAGRFTNYTQIYDVATGTWSTGAPIPGYLANGMAAASPSGIHLIGGGDAPNSKFTTHYLYSPKTDSWSIRAPLSQGLDGGAAITWEGRVYVFGGNHGGSAVTTTALAYDPAADRWSTLRAMPTARLSPAGTYYDGGMVVSGGWGGGDGLQVVESYDPSTDSWSTLAPLPERREAHASGVVGGRLCVAGGRRARYSPMYSSTYCLEPAGWVVAPSMPIPLDEVAYVSLGDALYTFGGSTAGVTSAVYRLSVEIR